MDLQRNLLFIVWLFVSFFIWQLWEADKTKPINTKPINTNQVIKQIDIPSFDDQSKKLITVKTDVLELNINSYGGDIDRADLLRYQRDLRSSRPFSLLIDSKEFVYQAQSGLIGKDGPENPYSYYNSNLRPLYWSSRRNYVLQDGQNELRVPLIFEDKNGTVYQKVYVLKRGQYKISVEYYVNNNSKNPLILTFFGQLKQSREPTKESDTQSNNFALYSYRGAAYSSDKTNYKKYSFSDISDNDLNVNTKSGWIAMLQQYFVTAWIIGDQSQNTLYTVNLNKYIAVIGYKSSPIIVEANSKKKYTSTLWIGPKLQEEMAEIAPHLDLTVDYGWLWFISQPLFKLLKFIHGFVGNWGFSIIIITFVVRGIMYPLTKAQYTSMAKMRLLQPKLAAMKERIGDNKKYLSQEIMTLYKEEKINPLGGCLPIFIQMPIFLALYYMLMGSVELRHARFIGWIQDLSSKDPYYALPLFMGLTMYVIQRMSSTKVADSMQQSIITYTPIFFVVFFLWFPSGLVLYYIVSNLVTIIQQKIIYRSLEKCGLHIRVKKKH